MLELRAPICLIASNENTKKKKKITYFVRVGARIFDELKNGLLSY